MTTPFASLDDQTLELSVSAMKDLADALEALCVRLQSNERPLDPDSFDRLIVVVSSMFADALRLCSSTQALDAQGNDKGLRRVGAETYEALNEALSSTRAAVKLMLARHRPLVPEHAEAISVLSRIGLMPTSSSSS